jgi:hypothetical protein
MKGKAMYPTPMGYTTRRPKNFPALDRSALMHDAHGIAKGARHHFPTYREALAYGLIAAWKSATVRREFQSLNKQAGQPTAPLTVAEITASRNATRRTGASLWAA